MRKIDSGDLNLRTIVLETDETVDEISISKTLKPVSRLDIPVLIDVYSKTFFKANTTVLIFED